MPKKEVLTSDLLPASNLTVVKHNKIVDAGYTMSIYEQRILLTCIARIDSTKALDEAHVFEVTVGDITDLIDASGKSVYSHLKDACDKLFQRIVKIEILNKDGKIEVLKSRWVYAMGYKQDEGKISLRFAPELMPFLTEISRDFTRYKLSNILKFKSTYSIRLYELICRWMGNEHIVELAWLKEKFELEDKYPIVADFRKRVIDPAIEEINLHSDMNISYTQVKSGRTVTGFKFSFSPKSSKKKTSSVASQHSLFLNPDEDVKKSIGISQKTTAEMDNIEHFAEARRKFGSAVSNAVPPEIIEILKSQGRW